MMTRAESLIISKAEEASGERGLTLASTLEGLFGDSLDFLGFIHSVRELAKLPDDKITSCETLGDLARAIELPN